MKRLFKGARKGSSSASDGGDRQRGFATGAGGQRASGISTRKEWIEHFIAYSCGTGSDDWEGMLAVGDECGRNADSAKHAIKALRQEFQLGARDAQAQATRILVILWRNSGEFYRQQAASKKFLQVYESALKRADTELHALMLKALMVLSYDAQSSKDLYGLTQLYNKHKNPGEAVNGEPLLEDDITFEPAGNPQQRIRPQNGQPQGRRDLWTEAEKAKSRAKVLSETLSFTPSDALDANELVNEFYAACQKSQSIVVEGIPWASQKAEEAVRSRGEQEVAEGQTGNEERLLAALMEANEELTAAFSMFDDAHRRKRATDEERLVQERSIAEQRMPSSKQSPPQTQQHLPPSSDPYGGLLAAPFASNGGAPSASGSSSRSPSPPPPVISGPLYSKEPEPYDTSDPFNPPAPAEPPLLGPYRTASPAAARSASPAASATSRSNPFHQQPQPQPMRETSPEPEQNVTVTRRGSKLMSNNPFASAITRERQSSDSSAGPQPTASPPPNQSLAKLQLGQQAQPYYSPSSPPSKPAIHDDSPIQSSPDRSLTSVIPEEWSSEPDRNPFHPPQLASSTSGPPASPSSFAFGRARKASQAESIVQTPTEPSDKAMGKLRRYSGMYGSDVDEANRAEQMYRQNEEKLRERYAAGGPSSRPTSGGPGANEQQYGAAL